jgi:hypothetical protein
VGGNESRKVNVEFRIRDEDERWHQHYEGVALAQEDQEGCSEVLEEGSEMMEANSSLDVENLKLTQQRLMCTVRERKLARGIVAWPDFVA